MSLRALTMIDDILISEFSNLDSDAVLERKIREVREALIEDLATSESDVYEKEGGMRRFPYGGPGT